MDRFFGVRVRGASAKWGGGRRDWKGRRGVRVFGASHGVSWRSRSASWKVGRWFDLFSHIMRDWGVAPCDLESGVVA